jgi:hypothetical protein
VLEFATQTKADNNLLGGSRRNTFMTTPVVWNSVTRAKKGACGSRGDLGSLIFVGRDLDGLSGKWSRMRTNSMTLSSSYLRQYTLRRKITTQITKTHEPASTFAMVKNTVRCSNSTLHFHNSHLSPGFHSAKHLSVCTSQHTTLPLFVAQRV